jgi:hypothetical protein
VGAGRKAGSQQSLFEGHTRGGQSIDAGVHLLPLGGCQPVVDLAGGEAEAQDLLPIDEAVLVSEQWIQVSLNEFHST